MTNKQTGTKILGLEKQKPKVNKIRIEARKGANKGQTWDLDTEPIRLGSHEGCQVVLQDATVSALHVELQRTDHGLLLRDLSSTNGTWVNGHRVLGMYISGPIIIQLGHTELKITPMREESPVEILADDRFGDLLGVSVPMRAVFAKLKRIAETDTTVLLSGETGTGKELAAAAIRDHGPRKDKPFVVVDCGALPPNLIESELFGHERGAFTGADRSRAGAFERAHEGTIFLDEIGELPLSLQPTLLGILERRELRRVGGEKPISIDVRVIAATNRDLVAEVTRNAFRSDLYYRLAVVEQRLPPLRERPEDIALMVEHFLAELPGERPVLSPATLDQLKTYPWPGNVRELRNVIERAALLSEPPKIDTQQPASNAAPGLGVDIDRPFKDQKNALIGAFERQYIEKLLQAVGGNVAAAARRAGIDRMYLYKLLERHKISA